MKSLMNSYIDLVKKASDEDSEQSKSFDGLLTFQVLI